MSSKIEQVRRQYSSTGEQLCTLCCQETVAWAVPPCDHALCLTCVTRLRVLCEQKECPVCRETIEKVVVVENPKQFSSISIRKPLQNRKYGFMFENATLLSHFTTIRSIRCSKCNSGQFMSIKQLEEHVRKEHALSFCEICLNNLKLFPAEQKLYTRQELIRHRREGDPDDKSHKGHPSCEFCGDRYFDKDELFFHLKNNHFWCHFCEVEGNQDYYQNYGMLKVHFREAHFLCEEGQCRYEKYTTVFLTKLDLQAHKAKVHTKGLSKAEAKQLRHVDVGFTYGRGDGGDGRVYRGVGVGRDTRHHLPTEQREREELEIAKVVSLNEVSNDVNPSKKPIKKLTVIKKPETRSPPLSQKENEDTGIIENIETEKVVPRAEKRKRPPGLERIVIPVLPSPVSDENDISPTEEKTDWPYLGTDCKESIVQKPPPGFPAGANIKKGTNSTFKPPPGLITAQSLSSCVIPPPGFSTVIKENEQAFKSEMDIFGEAQKLLNYDAHKINEFRVQSGLYQRGEISVKEYNHHCTNLFGTAWKGFGLKLANTLPDLTKREELHLMLSKCNDRVIPLPEINLTSLANKGKKARQLLHEEASNTQPRVWRRGLGSGSVRFNEDEFPSLGTAAQMPDPYVSVPGWNVKVAVK